MRMISEHNIYSGNGTLHLPMGFKVIDVFVQEMPHEIEEIFVTIVAESNYRTMPVKFITLRDTVEVPKDFEHIGSITYTFGRRWHVFMSVDV